jgi:hypothetical protein
VIAVRFTADELLAAAVVAAQRKITSDERRRNGHASRRPEHYEEARTWDQEIESSLAELAVCRWRNCYWFGSVVGTDAGTDAGTAQVRWTGHEAGHLIIYPEDRDDALFVLVVGRSPMMTIVGWARGYEVKTQRFWRADVRCPSWWMPQAELHVAVPRTIEREDAT